MDRPRISIFSIFILLLLLVEFVIPFRDLVIPAWNTLIIPAGVVKSIIALILLLLIGIYLYVQIKKIPKR
ncbi:hypothetical protein CLV99_1216 [Sphingobacterium yanglingense]|uniref:Uncharacterized protein n=1 Tax=Sphingobacterium yanglingense TaxID=1437280 RepID=A0A4R6WLB1_9SPHI|nr:hypothetical protein CLV99_1216 [Sphingobacterium yanglingense]